MHHRYDYCSFNLPYILHSRAIIITTILITAIIMPVTPFPSSSTTALSFPFPFSLEVPSSCSPDQPTPTETPGMGQIAHGTDHIAVHLKMHLSELIHLLLHHDLLMSHLQTLTFWRRNHNNGPTLSW